MDDFAPAQSDWTADPAVEPIDPFPPTLLALDATAAGRWQRAAPAAAPWLHEHVGAAMQQRLDWLRHTPARWCNWQALRGGEQTHALLAARYPEARCEIVEATPAQLAAARQRWQPAQPWWRKLIAPSSQTPALSFTQWSPPSTALSTASSTASADAHTEAQRVDLLWANMCAHTAPDARALLAAWHARLAVGGILMFSCLGPDTAREIAALYRARGWGPPAAPLADMHDWGDALVHTGFAEPVMDTERLTLTFPTPERLLQELRELGRNFHPSRHPALRGRAWHAQLLAGIAQHCRAPAHLHDPAPGHSAEPSNQPPSLALTVEIIYGHAICAEPRVAMQAQSAVSLQQMRRMLQRRPRGR